MEVAEWLNENFGDKIGHVGSPTERNNPRHPGGWTGEDVDFIRERLPLTYPTGTGDAC